MDIGFDAVTGFFAQFPADWLLIAAFVIIVALDCIRSGARRVCTLGLALPAAALVSSALPNAAILGDITGQFSTPLLQGILFGIIFVVMYFLIHRLDLSYGSESGKPIHAALSGVAAAAIVIVVWMETPALRELWSFGTQVQSVFGETYHFWWLVGSYATLAFVRRS